MPAPAEKPVTETIQAKHVYSQEERNALVDQLTAAMQSEETIEAELASVKADFKSRLERVGLEKASLASKLRDKFEMRPTLALVAFDAPQPGRKSYFVALSEQDGYSAGAFVRDEPMTFEDKQRKLPLEEPAPSNETLTNSFDSAQSKDLPPAGFALVTEGESQEGDLAFSSALNEWGPAAVPGNNVANYQALARPIGTSANPEPLAQKENAALTPFGEALQKAAAGKDLPLVPVKLSKDFTADKARSQFRKAARKNGWPEAAVDLMDEEALKVIDPSDEPASLQRVLQLLTPHCVEGAQ